MPTSLRAHLEENTLTRPHSIFSRCFSCHLPNLCVSVGLRPDVINNYLQLFGLRLAGIPLLVYLVVRVILVHESKSRELPVGPFLGRVTAPVKPPGV
jgi:hypothetical protein